MSYDSSLVTYYLSLSLLGVERFRIGLRDADRMLRDDLDRIHRAGEFTPVAARAFLRVSGDRLFQGVVPADDVHEARLIALLASGAFFRINFNRVHEVSS